MDFDDHTRWLVAFIIFIVLPSSGFFNKQDIILVGVTWHMAAPRQHYDVHNITLANYFDRHIMCQKTAFVEICCYNMGWEEKGAINDGPSYSKPRLTEIYKKHKSQAVSYFESCFYLRSSAKMQRSRIF